MKLNVSTLLFVASLGVMTSCTQFPLAFRPDIQQGNVIDQEAVDQLKIGMSKDQVGFLMGYPILKDPFKDNRWDYVFLVHPGRGETTQRHISLYFMEDELVKITGDLTFDDKKSQKSIKKSAEKKQP